MNERLKTREANGGRSCQVDRCSLPPSVLPWTIDLGGVTLVLWLCHGHGQALTGEQPLADAGGEAA